MLLVAQASSLSRKKKCWPRPSAFIADPTSQGRTGGNSIETPPKLNIPTKGFSTHSESSSLGREEFGLSLRLWGDNLLSIESICLYTMP